MKKWRFEHSPLKAKRNFEILNLMSFKFLLKIRMKEAKIFKKVNLSHYLFIYLFIPLYLFLAIVNWNRAITWSCCFSTDVVCWDIIKNHFLSNIFLKGINIFDRTLLRFMDFYKVSQSSEKFCNMVILTILTLEENILKKIKINIFCFVLAHILF